MTTTPLEILLVEDDAAYAALVTQLLERLGAARVTHRSRLRDGLAAIDARRFDVLLLDLSLPDGWGLDLLAAVRERAPDLPVVVLTGRDDDELAISAVQRGAQDYLLKSQVDSGSALLPRALRYAIERHRFLAEQKELEQRLRAAQAATEEQVRQRTAELTNKVMALEQRERWMRRLNEMSEWLQSCQTFEEAFRVIARSAELMFAAGGDESPEGAAYRAETGLLAMARGDDSTLEVVAAWGAAPPALVFAADQCWACRRGRLHRSGEMGGLTCAHKAPGTTHSLCVPLLGPGGTMGVLHLATASPAMNESSLARNLAPMAAALAVQAALALSNLQLRGKLERQALRDPLTGLYNRRYMEESLERELRRAQRTGRGAGLLMLDIDYFKNFNDRHGHGAGDALLQAIGRFLEHHTRGADLACRYGGEEFLVLLPDTDAETLRQRAEEIRAGVERIRIEHDGIALEGVSLSVGVAAFPGAGGTAAQLLRVADQALYAAKAAGRNQVKFALSAA
ncbi:MAG TPA: GGDEF domain-containing response regulator [Terriglobales bacterium]|nr:GGDEF domain-containing response regulator [Terriglobales bacterium]